MEVYSTKFSSLLYIALCFLILVFSYFLSLVELNTWVRCTASLSWCLVLLLGSWSWFWFLFPTGVSSFCLALPSLPFGSGILSRCSKVILLSVRAASLHP
ncbi:hypothetical protein BKA65DRAFT_278923 [Rhexocercosporidium sp. MPI-PUGE-AT-0058]|nr:hypothetical protein BKA65DRAFT_278923 [Rhexocercosporidium sp. MPI-PUGE-AT-0058]